MIDKVASSGSQSALTLEVEPDEEEWGGRTDRWREDAFTLRQELERMLPGSVEPATARPGDLGADIAAIILTLGTSGAITAAIEAFKVWIDKKPAGRGRIKARLKAGGQETVIVVDGENVQSEDLVTLARNMLEDRG